MIDGFMRATRFAAGVVLCACVSTVASAQKPSKGDQKAEAAAAQAQQQEYATVVHLADAAMAGQSSPADFPIQFQNDFLRAQGGRVWVPITLTLDSAKLPSSAMTMYLRVAPRGTTAPPPAAPEKGKNEKPHKNDKSAPAVATLYPYDSIAVLDVKAAAPGQPVRIVRGFDVPPGNYDLYVVLRERAAAGAATAKASVLKQPLNVPNYSNGEFSTSSVILADRVETLPAPLPPDQQTEHPYAFGTSEIVVSPEHKFRKAQELIVLVQVYNPAFDKDKKFTLEANYAFYRQEAGGEKFFNKTDTQPLTPEGMGPGFDPSGNAAIQAGQGIPLQSFPEGIYRLEIKITDKLNSKVLTQNVNFTVTP
jgi:hypothetical protein